MPAILAADEKLGELIGYYLAEGCIDSGGFVGWYFSEKEENYVNDVKRTLQRIFKAETKKRLHRVVGSFGKGSCYEVGTKSKVLAILFQRIFGVGNDSHTKTIPGQFFGYSEGFRRGLVRGYIRGDGSLFTDSRDRLPHISAASVSRGLIRRLHLFLLTLGINSSIVNASPTTYLHIGTRKDVEKFIREIEPEEGVVLALPAASTDLQDAIPNVLLQASAAKSQSNFARNRRTQASNVLQMSPAARELFSGNVRYDEITAVEEVYRTPWVYDLETETHAFMHGGGVFSHNSVIGGNVIRFACKGLPSKRMLFSSLTEDELQEAFDGRGPLDASAIDAGEARHTLDWYWGINASRALMQSLRAAGRYKVMSIGRVQGPALAILAKREKEIAAFVPQAYWQIAAHAKDTEFLHEKERFFDESEANAVYEECKGQQHGTVASVNVRTFKQPPQPPFDLTTLQVEAYRNFGFSPSRTLELAQDLYEQALVSYPRTSSQKLPEKLGLPKIIQQLGQNPQYSALASQLVAAGRYKPREGAKEDSAHVAIYPTGVNPGRLSAEEAKLYDLVARRFLSCFAEPAERESMKVRLLLAGRHGFVAEGTRTLRKGWFDFYGPYVHLEEVQLPPFSQGEQAKIQKVEKREKQTQPPKRYTPASIVRELERQNLGTKSTRSAVVDTLYSRSYLADKKSIKVTAFGLSVHDALQKNVPEIMDEKLTRKFEEEMDSIQEGKFDKDKVVAEGRAALEKILEEFKEREEGIGKSLAAGLQKFERHEDVLGSCNLCKEGKIVIKKSKFGFFAACNKYPACKNTFPLPRNAKIVPKNAQCPECATPEVRVFRKGRRPFEMCLLPSCPTKANWASNNVKGGAVAAEGKQ